MSDSFPRDRRRHRGNLKCEQDVFSASAADNRISDANEGEHLIRESPRANSIEHCFVEGGEERKMPALLPRRRGVTAHMYSVDVTGNMLAPALESLSITNGEREQHREHHCSSSSSGSGRADQSNDTTMAIQLAIQESHDESRYNACVNIHNGHHQTDALSQNAAVRTAKSSGDDEKSPSSGSSMGVPGMIPDAVVRTSRVKGNFDQDGDKHNADPSSCPPPPPLVRGACLQR